jgi:hypothetical protein
VIAIIAMAFRDHVRGSVRCVAPSIRDTGDEGQFGGRRNPVEDRRQPRFPLWLPVFSKIITGRQLLISQLQFFGTFSPGPVFLARANSDFTPPEKPKTGKLLLFIELHKHLSSPHLLAA